MQEILLQAEVRDKIGRGKVKDLRQEGFIPAVVYYGGKESQAIKLAHHEFLYLVHQHRIEGVIISLKIKGDKKQSRPCIIKEIQYDPVHGDIIHVDFNEISLTKAIKVSVPVEAKGESVGVKQEGGSLEHIIWEVDVECLPTSIPKSIEVDVTQLKMGESVYVKDLQVPSGVKIINDPESIVLTVASPMKEEVVPVVAEGQATQEPEVIKEKKEAAAEGGEEEAEEKK